MCRPHAGVDIYGAHGEPVYAVETGKVALIAPFTGPHAGASVRADCARVLAAFCHTHSTDGGAVKSRSRTYTVLPRQPCPGSPWWLDTWCVMIEGASGVVNYGEVTPAEGCDRFLRLVPAAQLSLPITPPPPSRPSLTLATSRHRLTVGSEVPTGALVGTIATVLAKDKGRPTTMLHLELYQRGTRAFAEWAVDAAAPDGVSHRRAGAAWRCREEEGLGSCDGSLRYLMTRQDRMGMEGKSSQPSVMPDPNSSNQATRAGR